MSNPQFLWIVVYEIRDPGRQAKVRDRLLTAGTPVVDCVVEAQWSDAGMRRVMRDVARELGAEDRVWCYRVCASCREGSALLGQAQLFSLPLAWIF